MLRKAEDGDVVRKNRGWLVWCIRKALRRDRGKLPINQYLGEAVASLLPMLRYIDESKGRLTSYTSEEIIRNVKRTWNLEGCVVTFPEYVPKRKDNRDNYNRARRGYDSIYEVLWDGRRKRSLYRELPEPELEEDDRWEEHRVAAAVEQLLGKLNGREQLIIGMRFGLKGMPVLKLREIGEVLGISHERVRQLEARAMKKMAVGQTEVRELYKFVTGKEW